MKHQQDPLPAKGARSRARGEKACRPPKPLLITIDGPAGAGKTTVSRGLAAKLGYRYVDTGALYRAVAHEALRKGISPQDDSNLRRLCAGLKVTLKESPQGLRLMVNRRDITEAIRAPGIAMAASTASAQPSVRAYLLGLQRQLGKKRAAVFEGRDMGTVVFPDADVKFFLDADPRVRAMRRFKEMQHPPHMTLEEVEEEMRQRDHADRSRALAPLKAAPDAIRIDASHLSQEEVIRQMLGYICGGVRK